MLIRSGKHTLPLMEQIAAEVHRKGAHPLIARAVRLAGAEASSRP